MIVRLVRHGQSTWNAERRLQGQQDPPLSATGRAQARGLDLSGAVVLSSDLRRAVQTATLAGAKRPHLDARLREQGWGELEGLTVEAALARYPDFDYTDVDAAVPGGESLRQVWDRLSTLDLSAYGDDVAVVTHGDTIRVALCAFAGRPVEEVGWVLPANGSVTVLEI